MKKELHPEYHKEAKIVCACGNKIKAGSTSKEMHIEICSACHPFYTGKEKLVDSAGQVDRFKKRLDKSTQVKKSKQVKKKSEKAKEKNAKKDDRKKSPVTAKKTKAAAKK